MRYHMVKETESPPCTKVKLRASDRDNCVTYVLRMGLSRARHEFRATRKRRRKLSHSLSVDSSPSCRDTAKKDAPARKPPSGGKGCLVLVTANDLFDSVWHKLPAPLHIVLVTVVSTVRHVLSFTNVLSFSVRYLVSFIGF